MIQNLWMKNVSKWKFFIFVQSQFIHSTVYVRWNLLQSSRRISWKKILTNIKMIFWIFFSVFNSWNHILRGPCIYLFFIFFLYVWFHSNSYIDILFFSLIHSIQLFYHLLFAAGIFFCFFSSAWHLYLFFRYTQLSL